MPNGTYKVTLANAINNYGRAYYDRATLEEAKRVHDEEWPFNNTRLERIEFDPNRDPGDAVLTASEDGFRCSRCHRTADVTEQYHARQMRRGKHDGPGCAAQFTAIDTAGVREDLPVIELQPVQTIEVNPR